MFACRVLTVVAGGCNTIAGLIVGMISFLEVTVIELGLKICVPAFRLAGARFVFLGKLGEQFEKIRRTQWLCGWAFFAYDRATHCKPFVAF